MSSHFEKVKNYLLELGLEIVEENADEELVVVRDEERGINNLIIDCEEPILILEQMVMGVPQSDRERFFERLLQINRNLIHGAFVLDEESKYVLFRDTLQLQNLDFNELEGSILALELALVEYGDELASYVKAK
ncbi:MAG TPA: molecular chaperone Tir [Thermodesulforhabdus norvegica]|uniref:Molecular chaperone Tir n=1 Tax=Thermodesulforhabdus norvegica TaxID=39841 RepID=A0A7C0WSI0_9BACT|nr:YbjN domain-containing protein [Deltaproteobacteria bacterium]MBW2067749.1 YbjN domain-containing protein [Deltaproteobacteria bacterium]HDL89553.1 molecular chaperone Tir [Thermodesulforhabdus norvegica]